MKELQQLEINALAWLFLAVPGLLICVVLWRLLPAGQRRLLPWPRWQPVPWLGVDVWIAFIIMLFIPMMLAEPIERSGLFTLIYGENANAKSLQERKLLWVGLIALPFQLALILGALTAIRGARPADLGITARRLPQNSIAGYLTWLVVTPFALLLYWVVGQFTEIQKHPMERLTALPLLESEWIAIVLLAVVAAPLMEELVFRGLLLRWQTGHGVEAQLTVGVAALAMAILGGVGKEGGFNAGPMLFVLVMLPVYGIMPYLRLRRRGVSKDNNDGLPEVEDAAESDSAASWPERVFRGVLGFVLLASEKRTNVVLAIHGNGLLFAAFHASVWPSPVALYFLGIALAWLAQRTQSLVGPIVAHALFNGVASLDLFLTQAGW